LSTARRARGPARCGGQRRHIRRQFLARARRRDLLEGLDGGTALGLGLAEHALAAEGEDDVFGRQLVAIVELHALAQLHLDGLVVDATPLGGEARHGSRLPRQFLEIRPSQIEEKNTRSPTLDCSRSTSSVFELVTFCTAIVIVGRLSACQLRKRRQQQRAGCGGAEADDRTAGGANHGLLLLRQSEPIFRIPRTRPLA
jgi:hypothetical protein